MVPPKFFDTLPPAYHSTSASSHAEPPVRHPAAGSRTSSTARDSHDSFSPLLPGGWRPSPTPLPHVRLPATKSRLPKGIKSLASYRLDYLTRLAAILRAQGLSPADLSPPGRALVGGGDAADRLPDFRATIIEVDGIRMAVANSMAAGGSGKFSCALSEDGQLLAVKSVRTVDKPRGKTAAMEQTAIDREVAFLRRYLAPSVQTFAYGTDGKHMVVMPLGLTDLARPNPLLKKLRAQLAQQTLLQVAGQLAQMHADGVMHHDVKPANIVIFADGSVRLIDMGEVTRPQDVVTAATPIFAAPEVIHPQTNKTTSADLWSLGLTIALVRRPAPRGLVCSSADPRQFFMAHNALMTGLRRFKGEPTQTYDSLDLEEDSQTWANYFRAFRAADPDLAKLVFEHMLVPAEQRSDASALARLAGGLPHADPTPLQAACRQLEEGPKLRAMRVALQLRLSDELGQLSSAGPPGP